KGGGDAAMHGGPVLPYRYEQRLGRRLRQPTADDPGPWLPTGYLEPEQVVGRRCPHPPAFPLARLPHVERRLLPLGCWLLVLHGRGIGNIVEQVTVEEEGGLGIEQGVVRRDDDVRHLRLGRVAHENEPDPGRAPSRDRSPHFRMKHVAPGTRRLL